MYGATIPDKVPNVFDMPKSVPANGDAMST